MCIRDSQELQAGDEVKEKISKEIERFKNTNSNVSENAVLRGYIAVSYTHLDVYKRQANDRSISRI